MDKDPEDRIPIVGRHRGVGLHDQQDDERLEVVRGEIDQVLDRVQADRDLIEWAKNISHAPESRLLAGALLEARFAGAVDGRRARPDIDLVYVHALVAGLNSVRWRDRKNFGTILSPRPGLGGPRPVPRKIPLPEKQYAPRRLV